MRHASKQPAACLGLLGILKRRGCSDSEAGQVQLYLSKVKLLPREFGSCGNARRWTVQQPQTRIRGVSKCTLHKSSAGGRSAYESSARVAGCAAGRSFERMRDSASMFPAQIQYPGLLHRGARYKPSPTNTMNHDPAAGHWIRSIPEDC
jgi:hypothetical protein